MSRLRSHHHPKVTRALYVKRWTAWCSTCGWAHTSSEWHIAYLFARVHAEENLR